MKQLFKIKSLCLLLTVAVITTGCLLAATVTVRLEKIEDFYTDTIHRESYKNTHIYDRNGLPIYDGAFSEDAELRRATFHIIGDKFGSVPQSILTRKALESLERSNINGYIPQKQELHLSIDLKMQKTGYCILSESGYRGCMIVTDYTTGEILSMVSVPSVDVLDTSYVQPTSFMNKALSLYPPASTFKTLTAAAAIESNPAAKDFIFNCTGVQGHIKCFNSTSHGYQNLYSCFKNSCNCRFASLANEYLSEDLLDKYSTKFRILDSDISDFTPQKGKIETADDLLWTANGQSKTMVSPIALTGFYNSIANNGVYTEMNVIAKNTPNDSQRVMSDFTAEFLQKNMEGVTENMGIGSSFGKTGTAQLDNAESHSIFVCALTGDNPPYTVMFLLENRGNSEKAKSLRGKFIKTAIFKNS